MNIDKTPPKQLHFPRVKEAREALQSKALKWAELYDQAIETALKKGELEIAIKAIQWAEEHMPADDGLTVLDSSVDKVKVIDNGPVGPTIQIGFALGGIPQSQGLPAMKVEVIDLKPELDAKPVDAKEEDVKETLPS